MIGSTWFPYARPLIEDLPGRCIELRCVAEEGLVRERYQR